MICYPYHDSAPERHPRVLLPEVAHFFSRSVSPSVTTHLDPPPKTTRHRAGRIDWLVRGCRCRGCLRVSRRHGQRKRRRCRCERSRPSCTSCGVSPLSRIPGTRRKNWLRKSSLTLGSRFPRSRTAEPIINASRSIGREVEFPPSGIGRVWSRHKPRKPLDIQ